MQTSNTVTNNPPIRPDDVGASSSSARPPVNREAKSPALLSAARKLARGLPFTRSTPVGTPVGSKFVIENPSTLHGIYTIDVNRRTSKVLGAGGHLLL